MPIRRAAPSRAGPAPFRVCTVGIKAILVFLELFPSDISRMMVGEKDFPDILIWETDRMVFEIPIGINGFVIAVTSINICSSIGRGVDGCKDAAVGQSSPGDFPIPGTSISASCSTEHLEKRGDGMLDFFRWDP